MRSRLIDDAANSRVNEAIKYLTVPLSLPRVGFLAMMGLAFSPVRLMKAVTLLVDRAIVITISLLGDLI